MSRGFLGCALSLHRPPGLHFCFRHRPRHRHCSRGGEGKRRSPRAPLIYSRRPWPRAPALRPGAGPHAPSPAPQPLSAFWLSSRGQRVGVSGAPPALALRAFDLQPPAPTPPRAPAPIRSPFLFLFVFPKSAGRGVRSTPALAPRAFDLQPARSPRSPGASCPPGLHSSRRSLGAPRALPEYPRRVSLNILRPRDRTSYLGTSSLEPRTSGPRDLGISGHRTSDLRPSDLGPSDFGPRDIGPRDIGPRT